MLCVMAISLEVYILCVMLISPPLGVEVPQVE